MRRRQIRCRACVRGGTTVHQRRELDPENAYTSSSRADPVGGSGRYYRQLRVQEPREGNAVGIL